MKAITLIAYMGIGNEAGNIVFSDDFVSYAANRLGISFDDNKSNEETEDFKQYLVDWYFSGNWMPVYEGEEDEC